MKKHQLFHALLHSADLLERRLTERLAPLGVRPRQARVLVAIDVIGPTSQTVLAQEFDITKGSMSTMIDRLLALGLVQREKSETDRRGDVVTLSPAGGRMVSDIHRAWQDIDSMIEAMLGSEKQHLLAELSSELKTALGGKIPGEARAEGSFGSD
ncbi:MarR family winged helix-turn-helix transcriptional regulator [Puniceibacterium confluentis]|uniref:MarR family winged helix-turn-helix transcriptional regulator n=1 Tax=Puniceibacterium confluentis TaxID=1958944 RepID=UPI0011B61359|nr:MarR family winged helix-turn-helix transcriptional regulator [Puniceibacterium confluentis]